jgi:enterochelin esterase family protein
MNELKAGNELAIAAFWEEVEREGSPLVESVQDSDGQVYVTFLWKGDTSTENVSVWGGITGWLTPPEDHQLTRLGDSNVWFKTYVTEGDSRTTYVMSVNDGVTKNPALFQPDPLNPETFRFKAPVVVPKESVFSVLSLPEAPKQIYLEEREGVPQGTVTEHKLPNPFDEEELVVWVHTPVGYSAEGEPYGLFLLTDGWMYKEWIGAPTILDNLLAEGQIPPMVTVMVHTPNRQALFANEGFVKYLATDLLAWVRETYHVTSASEQTIVGGSSASGLAALYLAHLFPQTFGNVLAQSPSLWWSPDANLQNPGVDVAKDWVTEQYAGSEALPVKIFMEVGTHEIRRQTRSVRKMRDLLAEKGYELFYSEYAGGHDYVCWRGSVADGLMALTSTWKR